jgi:hypothetical protein
MEEIICAVDDDFPGIFFVEIASGKFVKTIPIDAICARGEDDVSIIEVIGVDGVGGFGVGGVIL